MRHVHLDPVGGMAGDMFIAAMLDAFPEQEQAVIAAAEGIVSVRCRAIPHRDHVLTGTRFTVQDTSPEHHHHAHSAWHAIRDTLLRASIAEPVRRHAIAIFTLLAEAEARVHGIEPEAVTFHEIGAADSIADIVGASVLIAAMGEASWSVSPLPLGGGRVRTMHGLLPVPAPATALLLEGFDTIDDGVSGERVTPTGAAILRHLCLGATAPRGPRRLQRSGIGFGTRTLPGLSNCVRALVFETVQDARVARHRELAVIQFEVDDQSAEDLAAGLDRLRGTPGVHDVLQMAGLGKKGRMATHVQVLVRPEDLDRATDACFRETTTIGLRTHLVRGLTLPRRQTEVTVEQHRLRVKLVDRPGGRTGKAEAEDVLALSGHAARARLRRVAERAAEEEGGP